MRLSRTAIGLAAAATVAIALAVWGHNGRPRPTTVTFEPPYPQFNAAGDRIRAGIRGARPRARRPIANGAVRPDVLYEHAATKTPSTYWLGVIGLIGNDRIVIQGAWTIRKGAKDFPEAAVYELDASAPDDLQRHWRVSEDVLLPSRPDAPARRQCGMGYMLSRYDAPHGPRTYTLR